MANTVSGTIVNSYSTAKIKATTDWGEVGGLVGTMSGSTISNCYFAGSFGDYSMGGIAYKFIITVYNFKQLFYGRILTCIYGKCNKSQL
ncbi:MAG: hypothetical protein ACLUR5_12470 [Eubacterium ventriosum]